MVTMTDEQKYSTVLKELGELLQSKNTTISCQRWQIDELQAKLAAAEKERDAAAAKNVSERHLLLDSEAIKALRNVNAALRECYDSIVGEIGGIECVKDLEAVQQVLASVLPVEGGAA